MIEKREKVEVTWIDSHSFNGWISNDEANDLSENLDLSCKTVGYKFRETDDDLVLVMSQTTRLIQTMMTIPKVAILKTRTLK